MPIWLMFALWVLWAFLVLMEICGWAAYSEVAKRYKRAGLNPPGIKGSGMFMTIFTIVFTIFWFAYVFLG